MAINDTIEECFEGKNIVFSDKSGSYVDIPNYVEAHFTEKSDKQTTKSTLKWVRITISNGKRLLLGVFLKIKGSICNYTLTNFVTNLTADTFVKGFSRDLPTQ